MVDDFNGIKMLYLPKQHLQIRVWYEAADSLISILLLKHILSIDASKNFILVT